MFGLIEYARMMFGAKAISTLSTGCLNALDYAKTRVQGERGHHRNSGSRPFFPKFARDHGVALTRYLLESQNNARDLYTGKVAAAKFFAKNMLPRLSAERGIIEGVDATVMEVSEDSF